MRIAFFVVGLALMFACGARQPYGGAGLSKQLESEAIALQQTNRRLEAQVATCSEGGAPDTLYTELVPLLKGTEATLSRDQNRTVITLPGPYLFSLDRLELREESAKVLDLLSMVLNQHREQRVVIEGHVSDRTLTPALRRTIRDEWALSFARADLVRRELSGRYAVDEARFTVSGRGIMAPVMSNDTSAGQAANERVIITVLPVGGR